MTPPHIRGPLPSFFEERILLLESTGIMKSTAGIGLVTLLSAGLLVAGCASEFVKLAPQPPEKFERLGRAEGKGCGALLILATAYNFIPAGLNSRVEVAYQEALKSVPGATSLVDVSIQEEWTWFVVGTMRCVTVTGEAIR